MIKERKNSFVCGLFIIIIMISTTFSYGIEKGSPFIQNFSHEDYKGHLQNFAVVQDKRGLVYFGNPNGVLEFDGVHWRITKISNNSLVRSLAVDRNNRVLVGAVGEFGYLEPDLNGEMVYISLSKMLKEEDRKFSNVWDIIETTDGIYFCTFQKIFKLKNGKIQVINGTNIRRGFKIVDKLVLYDKNKGIIYLQGDELHSLPNCEQFTEDNTGIVEILPYSNEQFLIITEKKGFFKHDINALSRNYKSASKFPSKFINEFRTDVDDYLKLNKLSKGIKVNNKLYAIITLHGGIILMKPDGTIDSIITKKDGLSSNTLVSVNCDQNQNLWVTSMKGLSYVIINSPLSKFTDLNGVDEVVIPIKKFNDKIYLGAINGTFYQQKKNRSLYSKQPFFKTVVDADIECFDLTIFKNILFGFSRYGLFHLKGNSAINYNLRSFPYSFGKSKKFPDYFFCGLRDGLIAVKVNLSNSKKGLHDKDVSLDFISNGQFEKIKDIIRKIVMDKEGNLWLTTRYNGVIYIRFNSDDISDFNIYRYSVAEGLPQGDWNRINVIDDQLLAITQKGIYKAVFPEDYKSDPRKIRFTPIEIFNGLIKKHSLNITHIFKNTKNDYWISTDKGMGIINEEINGLYNWNDIPFKKINSEVENIFLDDKGIAWISSHKPAIYRYDPFIKKNYKNDFNVYIRKVTVAEKNVIYYGNNKKKSLTQIQHKNNSVSFEFAAAYYENIKDMKYNWYLEGFDKDWKGWNSETKAIYTNLSSGNYVFKIKAKNIFDHESLIDEFKFTVSTPWYFTIYAILGYLLAGIFLYFWGIRLNSMRLISSKNKLEKIVDERTAEIEKRKLNTLEQAELLKESEEKYRNLVELADDGIAILKDEKFVYFNPKVAQLLKYSNEELIGLEIDNIINPKYRNSFRTSYNDMVRDDNIPKSFETQLLSKNGIVLDVIVKTRNISYNSYPVTMVFFHDISDRKRLEEVRLKSKKLESIGLLAGGIAHDFNNLLTVILGRLNLIKQLNIEQAILDQIDIIEQSAFSVSDLVKNFLAFSEGDITIKKNEFIQDSLKTIGKNILEETVIEFESFIPDDLWAVYCDIEQIELVINNILLNSIEAIIDKGKIKIIAENIVIKKGQIGELKDGKYVKVKIIDDGEGISTENGTKIFDPYFSTRQRVTQKGLGMGLSITYSVISYHNGYIEVKSELGTSTDVTFYLPVAKI